jgi:hypothetical protein
VTAEARRAIIEIRECIDPEDVRSQGMDEYGRPKWIIHGEAALGYDIQIVCAIEIDQTETEFITLYWED